MLVLVTVVAFVSLGLWQLNRLEEKRTFNASVADGLAAEPIGYQEAVASDITYRRLLVSGEYDVEFEALVLRARKGESGYHVLTPFIVDDGPAILVDRGWIPITYEEAPVFDAPPVPGIQTIDGLLWPAQQGSGVPDEFRDVVRRIDPEIQGAFTPYPLLDRYLVLDGSDDRGDGLPVAAPPPALPEGPHLGYAVQWFLFTGVVIVGYPLLLRRTLRRD